MSEECTADLDHPCDGGNNGDPCADCQRTRAEWSARFRREYNQASDAERNPEQYRQDMIEAGRGHLLRPEER